MIKIAMLILLARGYVGTPYQWGGRGDFKWSAKSGLVERPVGERRRFDCSGFVTSVIAEAGGLDLRDHTANMLFVRLAPKPEGARAFLAFWGPASARHAHASHVGLVIVVDGAATLYQSEAGAGVTAKPYVGQGSKWFLGERDLP